MRPATTLALLGAALLLQACAAYDGRGLAPGRSTAADVERTMGAPAEKLAGDKGEETWFYPRNPARSEEHNVRTPVTATSRMPSSA